MDPKTLAESSARWMQAGLEAFARHSDTHDFAVHHCAVAVEHLLKAYLASLHPVLVVDGSNFDSLLHATGYAHHANVPVTHIKTVGLAEALTRVERLMRPRLNVDRRARDQLLAARNGVAHAGVHNSAEVEAVLTTCVRIADPVLVDLRTPTPTYWGLYRNLHDRLAEEHANSVRIRYASKLDRAKHDYRRLVDGKPPGALTTVITALTAFPPFTAEAESQIGCPACGHPGWLGGPTEIDYSETMEVEGVGRVPKPVLVFYPEMFECGVCKLRLDGTEELELAQLPVEVPLPGQDPYPGYEPDWEIHSPGPDDVEDQEPEWESYEPEPVAHDEYEPDNESQGR